MADAQELGRRGFRVHPLKAKDAPYTKYSQTATSDPAEIAKLFAPFPNALIAIATGQGLVVVDDDRRGNGLDRSLPGTLIATTPKGGFHYYYRCSTPLRNSTSKVAVGVDIRAEGGYVVAPPSDCRRWIDDRHAPSIHQLTPLPGILLAACLRSAPAAGEFEPRTHVPAGERHDYLVRFAGWALANELSDGSLDDLWCAVFDHAVHVCAPWPSGDLPQVRTHIRSLCRWVIARESGQG